MNAINTPIAAPLPAFGSFPDVWEARQDSDVLLDDALGTKASTAIFIHEEADAQQQQQQLDESFHPLTPEHKSVRGFRHNPYSLTETLKEVEACFCSACTSPATTPRRPSNAMEPLPSQEYYSLSAEQPSSGAASFDLCAAAEETVVAPPPPSFAEATLPISLPPPTSFRFMPPPPPRMDTCDVLHACGCPDADGAVYVIMTKWYAKVLQVQQYFLPESDFCPPPAPEEYTFGDWCAQANEWWTYHFANMQKKVFTGRGGRSSANNMSRSPRQQQHRGYW
jgi:hypothetical protein